MSALAISWTSVLSLFLFELLNSLANGDWLAGSALVPGLLIYIIIAVLVALLFEGLHFLGRLSAMIASHTGRLVSYLAAGLVLFLMAFDLPSKIESSALMQLLDPRWQVAGRFLGLILAGLGILIIWPAFRRNNAVYSIAAALCVSALIGLNERMHLVQLPLWLDIALRFLLFALLYLNFFIRYRLDLAQGFEPAMVPSWLPKTSVLALLLSGAVLLLMQSDRFVTAMQPRSALLWACILIWVLLLRFTLILVLVAKIDQSEVATVQRQTIRLLVTNSLVLLASIIALPALSLVSASQLAASLANDGFQARLLVLVGTLLDQDQDSNSLWPGGDPDDENPCVRLDNAAYCQPAQVTIPQVVSHKQYGHAAISFQVAPQVDNFFFITIETNARYGLQTYVLRNGPQIQASQAVPLGSDSVRLNLLALLNGQSVYETVRTGPGPGMASILASQGYRTLCLSNQSGFFDARAEVRLDRGCQVISYESRPTGSQSSESVNAHRPFWQTEMHKYAEDKNWVWLHLDTRSWSRFQTQDLLHQLYRYDGLSDRGLILLLPGSGLQARGWAWQEPLAESAATLLPTTPALIWQLAGLPTNSPDAKTPGVLMVDPFRQNVLANPDLANSDLQNWLNQVLTSPTHGQPDRPGRPRFIFYPLQTSSADQIRVIDLLTGARAEMPQQRIRLHH
ncbi:MAG: hypothetical protein KDK39_04915 [Leptospiraceae bacterium]|nr:hypothetical protein [Leptospiraceae bacterium]